MYNLGIISSVVQIHLDPCWVKVVVSGDEGLSINLTEAINILEEEGVEGNNCDWVTDVDIME